MQKGVDVRVILRSSSPCKHPTYSPMYAREHQCLKRSGEVPTDREGATMTYVCTREDGHDGPHVAHLSSRDVCLVWTTGDDRRRLLL